MYRFIKLLYQVDSVELAPCCADSAADAPVLIYLCSSASEAAGCLSLQLLFSECEALIALCAGLCLIYARQLTLDVVPADVIEVEVGLVERRILSLVSGESQAVARPYETVDRNGSFLAGRDGIDAATCPYDSKACL